MGDRKRVRGSVAGLALAMALPVIRVGDGFGAPDARAYRIVPGVMEPSDPGVGRLRETTTITMDPLRRPGFCFLVHPPDDETYEVYSVHYLPAAPKTLTGEFEVEKPSHAKRGIQTLPKRVDGIRPFCFDFHEGDPLGEYRIEVFVNGALAASLRLDVVEPERKNTSPTPPGGAEGQT